MKRIISIFVLSIMLYMVLASCVYADLCVITSTSSGSVAQFNSSGSLVRTYSVVYGTQLAFGPDGDLYVMSSRYGGKVTRYNPSTGQNKGVVFAAGATDYVYGMAFGYDGDLYVSYTMVAADNTHKKIAHISGPLSQNPFSVKNSLVDGATNLTNLCYINFGPDGDLYSYDSVGRTIQRWAGPPAVDTFKGSIVTGLSSTSIPVFGPDGNIYIGKNRYQGPSGTTPGALMETFIDTTGSTLTTVKAVAFDPASGDLYAHDGSKVARFAGPGKANEGKYVSTFCSLSGLGIASAIGAMVFTPAKQMPADPAQGLYLSSIDWSGYGLTQFDGSGNKVRSLPGAIQGMQLAFGPDGDIYAVSTGFGGYITRCNSVTGLYKGQVFVADPDDYLSAMAFGPDGDIYVSFTCVDGDWGQRRVGHISGPTKSDAFTVKSPLIDKWPLYGPFTFTFGPDGDLYVSDGDLMSVQRWGGVNQPNTCKGNFISGVTGIAAFGPDNNLYIGVNRYQGPYGANPGQFMGQFIDLTNSGMISVKSVAFNPADGDLYAHDGALICRFGGPGKSNQGQFVSLFSDIKALGIYEPRQMIFAPAHPIPPVYSINDVKSLDDGTQVILDSALVSAVLYADSAQRAGFAVENLDRTVGIRIISSASVSAGDSVKLQGVVNTVNGERVVDATSGYVTVKSSGNTVPSALGMQNRSIAGGAFGKQSAVVDNASSLAMSTGCNNVGLLVKTWGRVTYSNDSSSYNGCFYIDDGTGLNDGSGNAGIMCRPSADTDGYAKALPADGSYVVVTGISGVTQIGDRNVRYIWTTGWQNIISQ